MPDSTSKLSDSELTEAIRNSDPKAFKIFYHRYFRAVYSKLWRKTRDPESAYDLMQDTFMRLWKNRRDLKPERSIKAYLFRITHNLAIDFGRKRSLDYDYFDKDVSVESRTLHQDEPGELEERVLAAITELPDPLQTVLTLNRFDGLKYREIAEALGISVKTVESRMSKALKILREKLHPLLIVAPFVDFF